MKYFKDLDNDITTESDALKEWLTTPTIMLENGVDAIAWWLVLGKFGLVQVFALFFSTPNQMGVPFGGSFDSEVWINLKKPQAGLRVQFGVWQKRA